VPEDHAERHRHALLRDATTGHVPAMSVGYNMRNVWGC
jgi:hypothetical protein